MKSVLHGPRPEMGAVPRALADQDREWVGNDPLFRIFIETLDAFATKARYSNLDRAMGLHGYDKDATGLVAELEKKISEVHGIRAPRDLRQSLDPYYRAISREI